jgi:DNA-binding NarL/FixJ family response regulator
VLAVDDHEPFRRLICQVVGATSGFAAVGEAESGERAVVVAADLEPDMVLMDVYMPGIGGIAAARRIKVSRPVTVVVLISTTHPDDLPGEARHCLADEIIWKGELRPTLLERIWQLHR